MCAVLEGGGGYTVSKFRFPVFALCTFHYPRTTPGHSALVETLSPTVPEGCWNLMTGAFLTILVHWTMDGESMRRCERGEKQEPASSEHPLPAGTLRAAVPALPHVSFRTP